MKKSIIAPVLLIPIGLLFTTVAPLLSKVFPMPDFLKGFFMGLGIVILIVALVQLLKQKQQADAVNKQ